MDSPEDTPPFRQTDSLPNRVGGPGWDWHDDKKALGEGIKRVYVIGAGASACAPYGRPTLKTLARNLCNFLDEPERRILVDAIYETLGVDLRVQADGAVERSEPAFRSCTSTDWSRSGLPLERNKSRMLMNRASVGPR
jgi:hypothetical protein